MAHGSEEMELVIVVDVLRRAGANVTLASVERELTCTCSRGVKVQADCALDDVSGEQFALIALPGGMPGATHLSQCKTLMTMLEQQMAVDGRVVAAMCASPGVVLAPRGWLDSTAATAHPAFVKDLPSDASANGRVVIDGDIITSRGPGTAIEFALALVEKLFGAEKAREVAGPMVLPPPSKSNDIRVPNEWRLEDAGLNT
jgi:4-methyl-5(b-hydroxyethyl)-thiazole monophosphate biosynthesis